MKNEIVPYDDHHHPIPRQANTDEQVISLWLHNRPKTTQRVYMNDLEQFLTFVQKTLPQTILSDLQAYSDSLQDRDLAQATQHRMLSAVKSLYGFAHRIGYLKYDIARALRLPKFKNHASERIITEADLHRMITLEPKIRNQLIIRVLYASALRVSEFCQLRWSMFTEMSEGATCLVLTKGGHTHTVLLLNPLWNDLQHYRPAVISKETPLFSGRNGKSLSTTQVWRIVRQAAQRAGIQKIVSPHVLRACHATHALERNCPLHIVQATLHHSNIAVTNTYLRPRSGDTSSKWLVI